MVLLFFLIIIVILFITRTVFLILTDSVRFRNVWFNNFLINLIVVIYYLHLILGIFFDDLGRVLLGILILPVNNLFLLLSFPQFW